MMITTPLHLFQRLTFSSNSTSHYFEDIFYNVEKVINEIIPNVTIHKTGRITTLVRGNDLSYYALQTYDLNTCSILEQSLVKGNLPQNHTEILVYNQEYNLVDYEVGQSISFIPDSFKTNYTDTVYNNFTISGILENFDSTLHLLGYSNDFNWEGYPLEDEQYDMGSSPISCIFITSQENFVRIINNFTDFSSLFIVNIDFLYDYSMIDFNNVSYYLQKYQGLFDEGTTISNNIQVKLGADFINVIINYQTSWIIETIKVVSVNFSILLILILISYEILNYNSKKLSLIFQLIKSYGLDLSTARRVIFAESGLVLSASLVTGFTVGLLISYPILYLLNHTLKLKIVFQVLKNPFFISLTIVFIAIIFLLDYYYKISVAKKVESTIPLQFKLKRANKFKRFFSKFWILSLFLGTILLPAGLISSIFLSDYLAWSENANLRIESFLALSIAILIFGIFFILYAFFYNFSKLIAKIYTSVGEKFWLKKKNFITLVMKNISFSKKNIQQILFGVFIVSINIIPSFVIKPSIQNHLDLNATIATGFSDLEINSWNSNQTLKQEISDINGVNFTAEIINVELYTETGYSTLDFNQYLINILVINVSNFAKLIKFNPYKNEKALEYDKIQSLEQNMSYMTNSNFAKKFAFNKGNILNSWDFINTPRNYQMVYIDNFDYFPAMAVFEKDLLFKLYYPETDTFQMVLNYNSYWTLINNSQDFEFISIQSKLLIKTDKGINNTIIKEYLLKNYNINAFTLDEIKESMNKETSEFIFGLFKFQSILYVFTFVLVGYFASCNTFLQRTRNIENALRIGASRKQIFLEYTLEFIFLVFIQVLISILLGILLLRLYVALLNINQNFVLYKPRLPWWFYIFSFLLGSISLMIGWFVGSSLKFRQYQQTRNM